MDLRYTVMQLSIVQGFMDSRVNPEWLAPHASGVNEATYAVG